MTGGTTYSFDASSLVLELEVPGRGTHVFSIDNSIPPDTDPGLLGRLALIDDLVLGDRPQDGLQFRRDYLAAESGPDPLQFWIMAAFFSTDTSIFTGGMLPLAPDPRLSVGTERCHYLRSGQRRAERHVFVAGSHACRNRVRFRCWAWACLFSARRDATEREASPEHPAVTGRRPGQACELTCAPAGAFLR